ncbi:MAG: AMP-binding protein [Chloroflexi bacterium]|nr:AMP-binding protein [Chloroflexota bacterium]
MIATERSETGQVRTVWELILQATTRFSDKVALGLIDGDHLTRWTYGDLRRYVERTATVLHERGVRRGDRVLLWGPNLPEWGGIFFALLRQGAIVVPLDVRSVEEFVQRVAKRTRATLLVAGSAQAASLRQAPCPVLRFDEIPSFDAPQAAPVPPPAETGPDDLVEIVFTSGTTGEPKGVMVTNGNLVANVQVMDEVIHLDPSYRLLSLLPLSHLFEQTVGLMDVLISGASTIYLKTLQPARIFDHMASQQITCMLCVPQVLELFLQGIEREVRRAGKTRQWELLHHLARYLPFRWRRLLFAPLHKRMGGHFQFFVVGGAALDAGLGQQWEEMGIKVLQGYGTTEACPAISVNRLNRREMDTVGWPVPGMEIRIAPDGEVMIRGPLVSPGYWENEEATRAAFSDGWYATGDLGEISSTGALRLRGRKKNMIVLANGQNVYPEDVEAALRMHPAVKDAVVVGLHRGRADVDVHAILAMHEPAQASAAVKSANGRLSAHQQIRGFTLWPEDDFPRTLTMKARRPVIEARLPELQAKP